ncbi:class I SAM-dependent methyltransferase [bacterium]|nr:class I SAM-dependent methyltransferase [bacterium]
MLDQAFAQLPGLEDFCTALWSNWVPQFAMKKMRSRASALLEEQMTPAQLEEELGQWKRFQLAPTPDPTNQELVGILWQSRLFQIFMGAIGFFPPDDIDLRQYMAPLYADLDELVLLREEMLAKCSRGYIARGVLPYWQLVLKQQAPHLYLEPFLPKGRPLQGCDLACGWGRICLTLSDYSQRHIHACDLAESSLTSLMKLAQRRELPDVIQTHRVDILDLPFEDNFFDFYLAFDIFEHLVNDVLDRCLSEMLRCGKVGAPLYTETPLLCFCPQLTHLQNWTQPELTAAFERLEVDGKRWRLRHYDPRLPDHFTFVIEAGRQ